MYKSKQNPINFGEYLVFDKEGNIICRVFENDYVHFDDPQNKTKESAKKIADVLNKK